MGPHEENLGAETDVIGTVEKTQNRTHSYPHKTRDTTFGLLYLCTVVLCDTFWEDKSN